MVEQDLPKDDQPATGVAPHTGSMVKEVSRGKNHAKLMLGYPTSRNTTGQIVTRRVAATMYDSGVNQSVIARQAVDQLIEWPDSQTYYWNFRISRMSPAENLAYVTDLIEANDDGALEQAKTIALRLVAINPKFDAAYLQLARIAMRQNWSPEGLHQAENLIGSALRIQPDSADAKILIGYVYLNQNRLDEAERMLAAAAASDPPNLWLFVNWGDLLMRQGRTDQALAKYRAALTRPMNKNSNDQARLKAYRVLLESLDRKRDLDGMEALYKQRIEDFGSGSCYSNDYARFLLTERGNPQGAIDVAQRALNKECNDAPAREALGLAHYAKWASTSGPPSEDSLNQAHVYLPVGPKLFYLLASSERTSPVIVKLLADKEPIDQKDREQMTALAYALQDSAPAAAGRLLKLGANPATPVGESQVPAALLPVISGDLEATRMLLEAGVDYAKLSFAGESALALARQTGNTKLIALLARKAVSL
jgi:tetratricopeptide (TPR) repeat protein